MSEDSESSEKKVDESWKTQVSQAHSKEKESPTEKDSPFSFFLSTLSMQAMAALGEIPHPATNQLHEELEQARYLIDVLGMLQEKTKGNLAPEESTLLENILYELRMRYVSKAKK